MIPSTLLSIVSLSTLVAALPVPLGVVYENAPDPADANAQRIEAARVEANKQVAAMQKTIADAKAGDKDAQDKMYTAFGSGTINADPKNLYAIEQVVDGLGKGNLRLSSANPDDADRFLGTNEHLEAEDKWNQAGNDATRKAQGLVDPATLPAKVPTFAHVLQEHDHNGKFTGMGIGQIGSEFHDPAVENRLRAGILIHEATHQLHRTGDVVVRDSPSSASIVPAGDPIDQSRQMGSGYATIDDPTTGQPKTIRTEADINDYYKDIRDHSETMHMNADSYHVFAGLCSARLRKRALMDADPIGYYLAKRQMCMLPPRKQAAKDAKTDANTTLRSKSAVTEESTKTGDRPISTVGRKGKGVSPTTRTAKQFKVKSAGRTPRGVKKASRRTSRKSSSPATRKGTKGTAATRKTKGSKSPISRKSISKTRTRAPKGKKSVAVRKGSKGAAVRKGAKTTARKTTGKKGSAVGRKAKTAKAPKAKAAKAPKAETAKVPKAKARASRAKSTPKSKKAVARAPKSVVKKKAAPKKPAARKSSGNVKAAPIPKRKASAPAPAKAVKTAPRFNAAPPGEKKKGGKFRRSLEYSIDELD